MFAEEVKGNAARRRQEEARARRRRAKQQQQKQQLMNQNARTLPTNNTATAVVASMQGTSNTLPDKPSPSSSAHPVSNSGGVAESGKDSIVAQAAKERQRRQENQTRNKASVRIQSFWRSYRSNVCLRKNQAALLSQRLKDVATVRIVIQKSQGTEYVPPPATVQLLMRQILFLTRSSPYKTPMRVAIHHPEDLVRIQLILRFVVMPGLTQEDENVDPFVANNGARRLEDFVRLVLVVAVRKGVDTGLLKTIASFLETIAGVGDSPCPRSSVVAECRSIILSRPTEGNQKEDKPFDPVPHASIGVPIDLVSIVRHHLLFFKGEPIPQDPTKTRENFYTAAEKDQSDILLRTLWNVLSIRDGSSPAVRFFTHILTVPLLNWRCSGKTTSMLLSGDPPTFMRLIKSFAELHAVTLTAGKISSLLPQVDTTFSKCPATNTQCLFGNILLLGRVCPILNGSDRCRMNYNQASLFFDFLATLLDALPLGTLLTSRENAVEWISDGGHHTPVILSPVVLNQCKLILLDSYVRDLWLCAIDDNFFQTGGVLSEKTDKDAKLEKELTSTTTAISLASKEARLDRSKRLWQADWAKKLQKGMKKMFEGDEKAKVKALSKASNALLDTSSVSRELAASGKSTTSSISARMRNFSPAFYFSLSRAYGILLARWGGGGCDDIVGSKLREDVQRYKNATATSKPDPCAVSLLNTISFSTNIVQTSWANVQSNQIIISELYGIIDPSKEKNPVRSLDIRVDWNRRGMNNGGRNGAAQLFLHMKCFAHALIITDDIEIHEMAKPLPIHQVRREIQVLKKLLWRACVVESYVNAETNYFGLALTNAAAKTMKDLYDRSSRRPLCLPKLWTVDDLIDSDLRRCNTFSDYEALLTHPVLRVCPFLVSFKRRLKLFERLVTTNRIDVQGQHNPNPFSSDPGLKPGIPVRIMRGRVLEDGLSTMNQLGRNMRQRIVVHYVNEAGAEETGVDVGGLFKEFFTDLSAVAFNPNYALFRVTEGDNVMYPNPSSRAAHGTDHIVLFEFLGRILGKALYEGITIHPKFSHVFLSFLRGDYDFLHTIPDLMSIDSQLYNNLMFLKTYDGDAEDLCLTFSIANDDFGIGREMPLIPGGADTPVTNKNKHRYIGLVAKYHVYDRLKEQSEAFTRGLWDVIDRSWLCIFNEPELQILISGPSDGRIDVDDMRKNTRYAGGYTGLERPVSRFWSVMASFSNDQQASLLRFVTSCERPPPLGFGSMNPPFTIQRVGIMRDGDKLPSSSTCFNTLKLPTYSSEKIMRAKLLYAIESGAGFELT